jgi:hypothetical protein
LKKAILIAGGYFLIASFTIVGNPFAEPKTVVIPIFGILLTLPWSLFVGKWVSSLTLGLEAAALLNAALAFFVLRKVNG